MSQHKMFAPPPDPHPHAKTVIAALSLGAAAALCLIVCVRRCTQILGPGGDSSVTGELSFLAPLGFGFALGARHRMKGFAFPLVLLGTMVAIVGGQRLAPGLDSLVAGIDPVRSSTLGDLLVCALVAATLESVPALGFGVVLSELVHKSQLGFSCAKIIGIALAGAVLGFVIGRKLLLPELSTLPTLSISLLLLCTILLLVLLPRLRRAAESLFYLGAAGVVCYALGKGHGSSYHYGEAKAPTMQSEVEFFKVGVSGDVRVLRTGSDHSVEFDGIAIASRHDITAEVGFAFVPRLLRPDASHVLLIGLGSGAAGGINLLFPRTSVLCTEAEPAVALASKAFEALNFRPERSPAFNLTSSDARSLLRASRQRFDLILVNYGDPRLPFWWHFLSRQFCALAKSRLSPGGILAHRLKIDLLTGAELASIARTALAVFPNCALVRISDSEAILLASPLPLIESSNGIHAAQLVVDSNPVLRSEFFLSFGTSSVRTSIASRLILGEAGLRRLGDSDGEGALVSDWDQRFASTGRSRRVDRQANAIMIGEIIATSASPSELKDNFARCGCTNSDIDVWDYIAGIFAANGEPGKALKLVDFGLGMDPEHPELLANRLIWSAEDDPKIVVGVVARIASRSIDAANRVGVSLWSRGMYQIAIQVFDFLTEHYPQSATLWANLAANYRAVGNSERSKECLNKALALDPVNGFAKRPKRESLSAN